MPRMMNGECNIWEAMLLSHFAPWLGHHTPSSPASYTLHPLYIA